VSHYEPYMNFDPVGLVGGFKGPNVSAAGCGLKASKQDSVWKTRIPAALLIYGRRKVEVRAKAPLL
jgi:hypothetical protein